MNKIDAYRQTLRGLATWDDYLMANSGLPGSRANLELIAAAAAEGDETRFRRWLELGPDVAPVNTPDAFLAVCGTVGLGWLLAAGRREVLAELQILAADPRWRIREGVALALQHWGENDLPALVQAMGVWATDNPWSQRAAVAALCEPKLLRDAGQARGVLNILDGITARLADSGERRSEAFRVLRQTLGYGWSVVVAAAPEEGKRLMQKWCASSDQDVRWLMRENLKKARLAAMDAVWVGLMQQIVERARTHDML
ncbi:MAG TPA: hypothetical protein VGA61_17055 [Anaerolineae bacterium]